MAKLQSGTTVYGNANVNTYLTVGTYVSATGNIYAGNTIILGNESVTGNITSGNILTGGQASATGNVSTANYFIGNGYYITGIVASAGAAITNGNSNVTVNANSNVTVSVSGVGNVVVFTPDGEYVTGVVSATGNVTGNYIYGNGYYLTGISATGGSIDANALTGNTLSSNVLFSSLTTLGTLSNVSVTGNATAGNVLTAGFVSATGNVYGNNIISGAGTGGNITGANIISGNIFNAVTISASGNVTGNYILGNGALLTGVSTSSSNINNGTSNITVVSSGGNITVGVSGVGNVVVFAPTGEYVTGLISASGNITGANVLTAGDVSATGNITGNNFITGTGTGGNITGANVISGNTFNAITISASGNITGNYFIGNGSQLTGLSASVSNVVNGGSNLNIATANANVTVSVSTVGNVLVVSPTGISALGTIASSGNITSAANIVLTGIGNIDGYNGYFSNNLTVIGIFQSTSNITANGAGIFYGNNVTGNNALFAGVPGFTSLGSNVVLQVAGNTNSYSQINFQNINGGNAATTEIIVTANNGNDVAYFGDFGIAGNAYANASPFNSLGTSVSPNDTYLYSQGNANGGGGNLIIGTNEKNGVVRIIANGSNIANVVATFSNGSISVTGAISATGNIQGSYVLGNGAFLTGISGGGGGGANIANGTSNVTVVSSDGNITVGVSGTGNVVVFAPDGEYVTGNVSATGNITGSFVYGNGYYLTGISGGGGGNSTAIVNGTSNVAIPSADGDITVSVSGVGNVVVIDATGNISATGNITGSFIYGNGAYLTGISGGGGGGGASIANGTSNVNITVADGNISMGVSGVGNVVVVSPTGEYVAGFVSASGNVYGNSFVLTGSGSGGISGTGNINAGNILSAGILSAAGNITGGGILSIAGNVITTGIVSATGNVTGSYIIGNGSQLTGLSSTITVSDQTASASTFYPLFGNATTGSLSALNTSSTKLTYVPSTGTLSATIFNTTSDETKKTNIELIPNALDMVEALRGVTFEFKDTGTLSAGLIAQDVEKYLPQLISQTANGKALNYNGVIGILVEAVKELSERVKKLENK